jgi:hypothetical protein
MRDTQTPRARNGLGVLYAARAAQMQDPGEVAGKLQVHALRILRGANAASGWHENAELPWASRRRLR